MKVILFLTYFTIILHTTSSWTIIECDYKTNGDYQVIKNIYLCYVSNHPMINTEESALINSVNGEHKAPRSYDDVTGFHAREKSINYFPRGLQKYFKNLKIIHINFCGLKEIRQSDLKPFPKLVNFFLESNVIEVIEEGLFDFNPNLECVGLWEARIVHIDSKVFDNLSQLSSLWLSFVPCVKKDAKNSKDKVKGLIGSVKNNCTNADFKMQRNQLENLENELKASNFENAKEKLGKFEINFNNSKFLRYRPIKDKLMELKSSKTVKEDKNTIELASKVDQEPESYTNVTNYNFVFQNLSTTITDEFRDIKNSLNQLKIIKPNNTEDKSSTFTEKLIKYDKKLLKVDEKLDKFEQKFNNFEKIFSYFEARNGDKLDKIDKEIASAHQKIGEIFEKIKGIEDSLVQKFEEILEKKLAKIFEF